MRIVERQKLTGADTWRLLVTATKAERRALASGGRIDLGDAGAWEVTAPPAPYTRGGLPAGESAVVIEARPSN